MANALLNIGFNNLECPALHNASCQAGVTLRWLVDCNFLQDMSTKLLFPMCFNFSTGLNLIVSAYTILIGILMASALNLITGFKRWNNDYIVKARDGTQINFDFQADDIIWKAGQPVDGSDSDSDGVEI
jgi:hypothetical protein